MDVRCDRCQTEYELEDASVAEGGASVQCTTCGHTFVVTRGKPPPTVTPPPIAPDAGGGAWMLTTEEGKTHRFRDPTTLQKWIVERRVGRTDRVCPPGGSWRRLADMDELRPFFEVVDQADRAAAAARGARPTTPQTPGRRLGAKPPAGPAASQSFASGSYASIDDDDDDVMANGRRSGGGRAGGMPGRVSNRLDSEVTAGLDLSSDDDSVSLILPARRRGPKLALGVLIVGLVAAAAYVGYNGGFSSHRGAGAAASAPVAAAPTQPPVAVPMPAPPAPAATPPVAEAPAAAPPAAAPPPSPPATPPVAAAPPTAAPPVAAAPPPPPPREEQAASGASASAGRRGPEPGRPPLHGGTPSADVSVHGHSYEQLVAEGDRALENGNTAKAQKALDEALKLQPDGVAAVTGSGYLLLDRQKPLAAIGMFKRALASAPSFPQALFGLGEAYRSEGEPAQAIDAYRRYLAAAPGGADAPAARRQLRELEGAAAPARRAVPSPASPDEGAGSPVAPPPQQN
jgi:predicted Zn finger-like uncharacterized protein